MTKLQPNNTTQVRLPLSTSTELFPSEKDYLLRQFGPTLFFFSRKIVLSQFTAGRYKDLSRS